MRLLQQQLTNNDILTICEIADKKIISEIPFMLPKYEGLWIKDVIIENPSFYISEWKIETYGDEDTSMNVLYFRDKKDVYGKHGYLGINAKGQDGCLYVIDYDSLVIYKHLNDYVYVYRNQTACIPSLIVKEFKDIKAIYERIKEYLEIEG